MRFCEPCRQARNWPKSQTAVYAVCEICGSGPGSIHDVTAMAIPLPDPDFTTTRNVPGLEQQNPFTDPPVDPRAAAIQDARDQMAAGRSASTSLPPNYESLKALTRWLAENGWDASQVADAVSRPADYWVYYQTALEGGDLASGN